MALVDGPTGENDNMICVAYKHQFDLINESTGDAYRLHHADANRVRAYAMAVYLLSCDIHQGWDPLVADFTLWLGGCLGESERCHLQPAAEEERQESELKPQVAMIVPRCRDLVLVPRFNCVAISDGVL